MGDMFSSAGASPEYSNIGEIYGEPIDVQEYENRVAIETQKIEAQGGQAMPDQVRNQVWFQMTSEMVLQPEFDELGITVSPEELSDIIFGNNIHPEVMNIPFFQDTLTKQFSKNMVINVRKAVDSDPSLRTWWNNFEKYLKDLRKTEEYMNLVEKGFYATAAHGEFDYLSSNRSINYKMVVLKYADSSDSLYSFTEDEVLAKYEEIKNDKKREQVESRDIEYVEFIVEPTAEDRAYAQTQITEELIEDFAIATNDSTFVMRKGDGKFYSSQYFGSGEFKGEADTLIFNADSGQVVGPYYNEDNDSYDIAKITDIRYDTVASVRHILLSTGQGEEDDIVEARADSVTNAIKRGADFEEMVTAYSEDPGSVATGGKYEDFPRGQMVTEFEDFSFDEPVGAIGVVKTQFGFHIIEVLEHNVKKMVQVAIVDYQVKPSEQTISAIEQQVLAFAMNCQTAEQFEDGAAELGLNILKADRVLPDRNQAPIPTVQDASKIIKWAYEAVEGEVANRGFLLGDRFIVPHLAAVREEGVPSLEDIRVIIEPMLIKDKKGESFSQQLTGSDIEQISVNTGVNIVENTDLKFSDNTIVGGGGNEPVVVGKIFAMVDAGMINQVSVPIVGEIGVYVIEITSVTEAPEVTDYTINQERLTQSWRSNIAGGGVGFYQGPVYRALEEKAGLKDYRAKVNLLNN